MTQGQTSERDQSKGDWIMRRMVSEQATGAFRLMTGRAVRVILMAAAAALIVGCSRRDSEPSSVPASGSQSAHEASSKPAFVVILLDETGSFSDLWDLAVRRAAMVVSKCRPGDCISVIGIDDHAGDTEDVRKWPFTLPEGALQAKRERARFVREVLALRQGRHRAGGSDIFGAIGQAVFYIERARKSQPECRPVVFVFSDFRPDQRWPTASEVATLTLPPDTEFHGFYVRMKGTKDWQWIVDRWIGFLRQAGLDVTDMNLWTPEETDKQLQPLLERLLPY